MSIRKCQKSQLRTSRFKRESELLISRWNKIIVDEERSKIICHPGEVFNDREYFLGNDEDESQRGADFYLSRSGQHRHKSSRNFSTVAQVRKSLRINEMSSLFQARSKFALTLEPRETNYRVLVYELI